MTLHKTDQGTTLHVQAAGQRVSVVLQKSVFGFSETMAPHAAAELGRTLIAAAEMASGAPLAAGQGRAS